MQSVGAFGKIPSLGDFFRLELPRGFTEPWDQWLQASMLAAQDSMGDRWQGVYLTAPIWRFTLCAGQAGPEAMIGILMPSVDRVGRLFPLTLARRLEAGQAVPDAHFAASGFFELLEAIALDALDDHMTRDLLADRLCELPDFEAAKPPRVSALGLGRMVQAQPGADLVAGLAAECVGRGFRKPCVWSSVLETGDRLVVTEGLPAPGQMTLMFDPAASEWASDPVAEVQA